MRQRKTSYPPVNVGTSFMLVVLIILSMVIFAVLCFSGVLRDSRYSEIRAARTSAYYTANNAAEEYLADIDAILAKNAAKYGEHTDAYADAVAHGLTAYGGTPLTVSNDGGANPVRIEYSVPMDEDESLNVVLIANDASYHGNGYYYISEWRQDSTSTWEGDDSLHLIGSGS